MRCSCICVVIYTVFGHSLCSAEPIAFKTSNTNLQITIAGRPFATYVFEDAKIRRPFFAHVKAPNGVQVTRNHPPKDKDATDHDTMHPGIWLGFGDLGGSDFWRNRGVVRHHKFIDEPKDGDSTGTFSVLNRYESGGKAICDEKCHVTIAVAKFGTLLMIDSSFSSEGAFAFGDQEEMGFGIRLATPLTVKNGGEILNNDGKKNEKEVWGKTANWCAYGGKIDGKAVGMAILPHPDNFRKSWFHARDYGLLVANPFGQRAFTKGAASRVEVKPNEPFRLRFGVLIYSTASDRAPDFKDAYRDYVERSKVR
jgi:Family of unknown function (DUF6807)